MLRLVPVCTELTGSLSSHPGVGIVAAAWPLWLLVGLGCLARLAVAALGSRTSNVAPTTSAEGRATSTVRNVSTPTRIAEKIAGIDRMTETEFAKSLEALFGALGYDVRRTREIGDGGGDLVVERGGTRTLVRAKGWTHEVGVSAVQEALEVKWIYRCGAAIVVTNGTFASRARELAAANDIQLWDRRRLMALLDAHAHLASTQESASAPTEAPYCARCGHAVSARARDYCVAHSDRFGGLVYCLKHQRTFGRT